MRLVRATRNNPVKAHLAKQMRGDMAPAETALWKGLQANRLGGLHFRRQQVIDGFIADFYCHAARVVVEVDGEVHLTRAREDGERGVAMRGKGLRVVRVTNSQVLSDLSSVLATVHEVAKAEPLKSLTR